MDNFTAQEQPTPRKRKVEDIVTANDPEEKEEKQAPPLEVNSTGRMEASNAASFSTG